MKGLEINLRRIGVVVCCAALAACSPVGIPAPVISTPTAAVLSAGAEATETPQYRMYAPSIFSGPGSQPEDGSGKASPPAPEDLVDPYVDIQVNQDVLQVGETLVVTAKPMDIGLPYYYLEVRDEGVPEAAPLAQVTYENEFTRQAGSSQVLELVSALGSMDQVIFELRATAPGITTVSVLATGEIHSPGGATWSGAGSGSLLITVNP